MSEEMNSLLEDGETIVIDFHAELTPETVNRFLNFSTKLIKENSPKILYLAMSTTGGSNSSAFILVNFLMSLPIKIVTHATGVVDSSGVSVFLTGSTRIANPVNRFLIHAPTWTFPAKTEIRCETLQEHVQQMLWDQDTHQTIMRDRTTATIEQITEWHRIGKILTTEEALTHGLIHQCNQFIRPERFFTFSN